MLYRVFGYFILVTAILSGLALYRESLIQSGYDKAVADYKVAESALKLEHEEDLKRLAAKNTELENENAKKKSEVASYRSKFAAVSERLRQQNANLSARIEEASCEGVRRYAEEVSDNFAGCRSHVERLGLEAASCSVAAEALREALDLTND
jgi:predicted RNase H-like nuclease (RuvC/YqgF family)